MAKSVAIPMINLNPFELKRYESLEKFVCAQYEIDSLDDVETIGGLVQGEGELILYSQDEQPIADYLRIRREMGCDGYVDNESRTLHYWIDPAVLTTAEAIQFFAHELAHLHRHPAGELNAEATLACEADADQFSTIAKRAYELALSHGVTA